jgi:ribonuclease HI
MNAFVYADTYIDGLYRTSHGQYAFVLEGEGDPENEGKLVCNIYSPQDGEKATKQTCELHALLETLEHCVPLGCVTVHTNSRFLDRCINVWAMTKWKHNGWVTRNGSGVKCKGVDIIKKIASILTDSSNVLRYVEADERFDYLSAIVNDTIRNKRKKRCCKHAAQLTL